MLWIRTGYGLKFGTGIAMVVKIIYVGITQRPDSGKWRCFWTINNKRKWSQCVDTEEDCKILQRLIYDKLNDELRPGSVSITWEMAAKEYKAEKELTMSDNGYYEMESSLDKFADIIKPTFVKIISASDIQKFKQHRMKEREKKQEKKGEGKKNKKIKLSPYTVNKQLINIKAFLTWCADPDRRYTLRAPKITKLPVESTDIKILTLEQIKSFFDAARKHPKMYLKHKIQIATSQRIHEIETLTIGQCDFGTNSIKFKPKKTRKHGKAEFSIPVKKSIMTQISNYISTLPEGRIWLFHETDPSEIDTKNLYDFDLFDQILADAKIKLPKGTKSKVFRQTGLSMLASVSVPVAKAFSRHQDTDTLMEHYVTPLAKELREAADNLPID